MSWLPAIPYPPSKNGYWSPVTSTLNWCEEDYYATIYSAEIVNTLTNLLFMYCAIKGISNCIHNGHDTIFLVTFAGYLIVGSGSFMFHASLKYPMQLVDELSMIYTTCLMFFATFTYGRSVQYSIWLGTLLTSLALFITGYYHYLQDPRFHQNAYAILTAIVLLRAIYVMELNIRPSYRAKQRELEELRAGIKTRPADVERKDKRDLKILGLMWTMIAYGLSVFLGGFALWNADNIYCSDLRKLRHEIGLPWGIFLEGHGWWHILTGIGAYFYITWGIWLRHCLNGRQDEFELQWPRLATSLPLVVRRNNSKDTANGSFLKLS